MNIIIGKNSFIAKKLLKRKNYMLTSSAKMGVDCIYLNLAEASLFDYSIINKNVKIIFLAAISSPDECNNNYEKAYKINVIGTKYFIQEVIRRGAKVLFFSSDVVYGNSLNKVDENTNTNPFGNYAKMKDEIEKEFQDEKNFKTFRLSYVLSTEDKYLSYLHDCINKNEVAEVFHPFSRKVIYIEDVLDAIENILHRWEEFDNQKFNICGNESISRKDIADYYNKEMKNTLKYLTIEPNESFWEARPKDINIESLYLERLLNREPMQIKEAINQIIKGKHKC
ncbi:MAG TPA: NAD-dependent epimerase/dehydratase family protein [Campylobacterales bacterium]|nr:NAD-dependent epimerase/dehydratase family protein [Campylobacterales bacterium]